MYKGRLYVIVVAGGSGTRMNSELPKQFMLLQARPVLMHTIERFYTFDKKAELLVVLPQVYHEYWKELCFKYKFGIAHRLVAGGFTRFHSVKNALDFVEGEGLVAIHDGVRPLVSTTVIERTIGAAVESGAAVPTIALKDSVRQLDGIGSSFMLDRSSLVLVQTPQVFTADIIKQAYAAAYLPEFTDDASVVEKQKFPITLVDGNVENLKITYQSDIAIAEALMKIEVESRKVAD